MLDFTTHTTWSATSSTKVPKVLNGQTVAKKTWTPRERAERAADWMQGRLHLDRPTKLQAANVFGASTSLITVKIRERTKRGCSVLPAPAALDALWAALDPSERAAFVMRNETTIWKVIDKLTA
jgi:hypothetical protein